MSIRIETKLEYNYIHQQAKALPKAAGKRTWQAAMDVAERVRSEAPIGETGAGAASVFASSAYGSTYDAAVGEARSRNHKAEFFPEDRPEGPGEATVGVAVTYMTYVHEGSIHNVPNPFMARVIDEAPTIWKNRISTIEADLTF